MEAHHHHHHILPPEDQTRLHDYYLTHLEYQMLLPFSTFLFGFYIHHSLSIHWKEHKFCFFSISLSKLKGDWVFSTSLMTASLFTSDTFFWDSYFCFPFSNTYFVELFFLGWLEEGKLGWGSLVGFPFWGFVDTLLFMRLYYFWNCMMAFWCPFLCSFFSIDNI